MTIMTMTIPKLQLQPLLSILSTLSMMTSTIIMLLLLLLFQQEFMGRSIGIYLHMELSGRGCQVDANVRAAFSEASSRDIADTLCDDLVRFGNPYFRHTIDCTIECLTQKVYTQALVTFNDEHQEEHQDEIEISRRSSNYS
mmetsp:Transcript_22446/g.24011  ORF Transcript_22446/g.24011 Transcript_22446/m.24011 type:complete len:141 (-) Transcript_22446:41-463(-)